MQGLLESCFKKWFHQTREEIKLHDDLSNGNYFYVTFLNGLNGTPHRASIYFRVILCSFH